MGDDAAGLGAKRPAHRVVVDARLGDVGRARRIVPLIVFTSPPVQLTQYEVLHLTAAGIANSGGLLLVYTALRRGKIGVVGPIVSTEGAIGATLAILAGDPISGPAIAILALIATGVVLAAIDRRSADPEEATNTVSPTVTAMLALGGALLFGINLYATSRIRPTCRSPGPSCRPESPAWSA